MASGRYSTGGDAIGESFFCDEVLEGISNRKSWDSGTLDFEPDSDGVLVAVALSLQKPCC